MASREKDRWAPVVGLSVGGVALAALAAGVVLAPLFGGRFLPRPVAAWLQGGHRPVVFALGVLAYGLPWWGLRRVHGQAGRGRASELRRRDGAVLWLAIGVATLLLAAPYLMTRF